MIHLNKYLNLSTIIAQKKFYRLVFAIIFQITFFKLTFEVFANNKIQELDQNILLYLGNHLRNPSLNQFFIAITNLGSPPFITVISLIAIYLLVRANNRLGAMYLFIAVIGGTIWMAVLKTFLARPRPQIIPHLIEVGGQSYPSGHALVSTSCFITLAFFFSRYSKYGRVKNLVYLATMLIIAIISFSRLYLGVHYPSDVLAGLLFGSFWTLLITFVFTVKDSVK